MPIIAGMDDSKVIDLLGGTVTVARLCKVKPPSVSGWRVKGIPDARRQFLQAIRPDVFVLRNDRDIEQRRPTHD